jgi:hypothetical protein
MGPATTGLVSSTTVGSGAEATSGADAGAASDAGPVSAAEVDSAAVAAAGSGVAVRGVAALRFVDVAVLRLAVDLLLGIFASDRFDYEISITDFARSVGGKKQFFGL